MSDDPNGRVPKAIRNHAPRQTLEMRGPDGSMIRRDMANRQVARDYMDAMPKERASRLVALERRPIAGPEQVRDGTRGRLSQEMKQVQAPERDRDDRRSLDGRAAALAQREKRAIASREQVRDGSRGILSKEMERAKERGMER